MSDWRSGKPRLRRRAAAADVDDDDEVDGEASDEDVAEWDDVEVEGVSLPSLVERLPYLFFR